METVVGVSASTESAVVSTDKSKIQVPTASSVIDARALFNWNKESSIKSNTSRVILDYFNVSNREFGESFFPQDIAREIFTAIPEVRLAEITNYKDPITLEFNEILQLNNFKLVLNYV